MCLCARCWRLYENEAFVAQIRDRVCVVTVCCVQSESVKYRDRKMRDGFKVYPVDVLPLLFVLLFSA